jgi:hypothetical protein
MKKLIKNSPPLLLALLGALPSSAQNATNDPVPALVLEEVAPDSPNRFALGARLGFNLKVDFRKVGAFSARTDPGALTTGSIDRFYDDGYNRVDITGSDHGPGYEHTTWYWGYDQSSQIQPSRENPQTTVMHSSSSAGTAVKNRDDDPAPGFELSYNRELIHNGNWRFGLESSVGYTTMEVAESSPLHLNINQLNDTFAVPPFEGGPPLPPAGYRGTQPGPGPVIGDLPSRTTTVVSGAVAGPRRFNADVVGLRLGSSLELALGKRVALGLSGGFALVRVDSEISFDETITMPSGSPVHKTGSGSHDDLLPGGYVGGNVAVSLTQRWGAFAGAQLESVGKYHHRESGREAVLDLNNAVFLNLGVTFSF